MNKTEEEYLKIEYERARRNLYKPERHSFGSKDDLAKWFVAKLVEQSFSCYYCDTSIFVINELIQAGLLKTRKARGDGLRGPVLEIDKEGGCYEPGNCVLACHYCNNDKSYITSGKDYKSNFGENRKLYFLKLHNEYIKTLKGGL